MGIQKQANAKRIARNNTCHEAHKIAKEMWKTEADLAKVEGH